MSVGELPTVETIQEMLAQKRPENRTIGECTVAVESVPRLGPTSHHSCVMRALLPLGIPCELVTGVYWSQAMTRAFEHHLADGTRYILAMDYDTIFSGADVLALYGLMQDHPEIDALASLQFGRQSGQPLFVHTDESGDRWLPVTRTELRKPLLRVKTAHFGLTMLRASSLRDLKKPWFVGVPDPNGGWGEGRFDEDIYFWKNWWDCGKTLYQANRVVVGHGQEMITWPDQDLQAVHQFPRDYEAAGRPSETVNYEKPVKHIGNNESIRLNLGSGDKAIPGFTSIDRIYGEEVYPLDWPDKSVVEIRASHVLEHLPQRDISDALSDWVRVLRPGGLLRIAVPDFDKIVAYRANGGAADWHLFLMGGQGNRNNYHQAVFDRHSLTDAMQAAGLTDIGEWISEIDDFASHPISLNLQGKKP